MFYNAAKCDLKSNSGKFRTRCFSTIYYCGWTALFIFLYIYRYGTHFVRAKLKPTVCFLSACLYLNDHDMQYIIYTKYNITIHKKNISKRGEMKMMRVHTSNEHIRRFTENISAPGCKSPAHGEAWDTPRRSHYCCCRRARSRWRSRPPPAAADCATLWPGPPSQTAGTDAPSKTT